MKSAAVVILLEGRDASGKTTTARDIIRVLGRGRVIAAAPPTEAQRRGSYFRRWLDPLEQLSSPTSPTSHSLRDDEVIVFDRSWYNRALVERVMGFCTPAEVEGFFEAVPCVERALMERGVRLLKFFFCISEEEQARRLAVREQHGELTAVDAEALARRDAYARAEEEMFARGRAAVASPRAKMRTARTSGISGAAEWIVLPESERVERLIAVLARVHALEMGRRCSNDG